MSDDGSAVVDKKKGRPSKAQNEDKAEKDVKKRGRPAAEKKDVKKPESDGEAPVKRGRGRPKGNPKKQKLKMQRVKLAQEGVVAVKKDEKKAESEEEEEEEADEED